MDSKNFIINNLRKNTIDIFPFPELEIDHIVYEDKIQQFKDILTGVGGSVIELSDNETIDDVIHRMYPNAKHIASNLSEIKSATFNPDDVEKPAELKNTDLAVFRGIMGICENGAVYYEQNFKHRAVYFIAESILMILDKTALVDTMHDAYKKIDNHSSKEFRGFISGPSKTADIEQSLVMGAHGAKECIVLLV